MDKCKLKFVGSCCYNAVPSKVCGVGFAVKVVLCYCFAQKLKLVFSSNGGVFSVRRFGHSACSPSNVCVCGAWTHVCIQKAHCSVFTALWCGCSVVKLTFYLHQTPLWLWLVWTNPSVFTPPGYRQVEHVYLWYE